MGVFEKKRRAQWVSLVVVLSVIVPGVGVVSSGIGSGQSTLVVDDDGGQDHTTIQAAVDAASPGDTIEVRAGNYTGPISVGTSVSIVGAGRGQTIVRSSTDGFTIGTTDVTIRDLTVKAASESIRVGTSTDASGFRLINTHLTDGVIAIYIAGDTVNTDIQDNGAFDDVIFQNVLVTNHSRKGFYIEKLSNATFDTVVVDGITSDTYGFNNGIDINLKNDTYRDIRIRNSIVANVTKGNPHNGVDSFSAAIAIKARDDAGKDYGQHPGHLDDVTFDNVTVRDSFNGLRFGEPGSNNQEPTNISVTDSTFLNNTGYHIQIATNTTPDPVISNNQFDRRAIPYNGTNLRYPGTYWTSIQQALDNAQAGDRIDVDGRFDENGLVLDYPVTIDGAGREETVLDAQNSTTASTVHAFIVRSNGTTIRDLTMRDGHNTIRISQGAHVEDFSLINTKINDSNIGMYVAGNAVDSDNGEFDRVLFRNTHWIDNERKAIYVEKLSNATFDGLYIDGVTGPNYGFNNGIDINLKGGNYTNITIRDSVVTGVGKGSPYNGIDSFSAAIAIKGRDDSSYLSKPGFLDGVTLDNVTIGNSFNGLRFGEPTKRISSPTNVTVRNSRFENNTGYHQQVVVDELEVNGSNNTYTGNVTVFNGSVRRFPATIWSNIGDGLDTADDGDHILVGAHTYDEDLDVTKDLTLTGSDATIDGRVDLQTDGITFQGFTITNSTPDTRVDGIRVSVDADTPDNIVIRNVTVEGLRNKSTTGSVEGIHIFASNPIDGVDIDNVTIRDIRQPVWGADGIKVQAGVSNVSISNATIENIHGLWSYGIVTTPSSNLALGVPTGVLITDSTIRDISSELSNSSIAVGIDSASGSKTNTGVAPAHETEVHDSSFVNVSFGVYNKDTGNVTNATSNYWGAESGPSGAGSGAGVAVSENVTFRPFLSVPGGGPPAVERNPTSLSFGNVPAKPDGTSTKTLSVTITSTGDDAVKLSAFQITGAQAGQFKITSGATPTTLDPLETQSIKVRYAPTSRASASATLDIATSAPGQATVSVPLSGTGTGSKISVATPEPVQFSTNDGSTTQKSITISNTGNAALTVTGASAPSPFSRTGTLPSSIAPGGSATIDVSFSPTAGGVYSERLTITSNDAFTPSRTVRLSGTAQAPGVDPSIPDGDTIDYGTIAVDSTVSIDVILTNNGTSTLTISPPSPLGPFSASVARSTLAPGASTALNVSAQPQVTGSQTGTLLVNTTARKLEWDLTATANASEFTASDSVDFGNTTVGSTNTSTLVVRNDGTLPLTVDLQNAVSGSPFSLVSAPSQVTIGGGKSRTITLAFSPTTTGEQNGTLTLETDDAGGLDDVDERTVTIDLNGTGTESNLSVVGDSTISFGPVAAGSITSQTITIQNTGSGPVTGLTRSLVGANTSEFGIGNVPSTLAAGATLSRSIVYSPGAVGDHRARVVFSGANGVSTSAILSGETVPPDIALNRTSLDLGYVDTGDGPSTAAVQISNQDTHGTSLSITNVDIVGPDASAFTVTQQPASSITGGATTTVIVEFDPTAIQEYTATLRIHSDDPDDPIRNVSLTGNGARGHAALSTGTIQFGDVPYGESATKTLTVTNNGGVPLRITGVAPSGPSAAQVSVVDGRTPITLVAGASETYTIEVTPTQTGAFSGTSIDVQTDENDPSATVAVNPIEPEVSTSPSAGSTVQFGSTRTGSATQRTLTISNVGETALTVGQPTVSGSSAYSVVNAPGTAYIGPGESLDYALTFAPTTQGDAQATMTFSSVSDPNVSSLTYTLNGTATQADARFSTPSVGFGTVGIGSTQSSPLVLENQGSAPFNVTKVAIKGADAGAFSVSGLPAGTRVNAGATHAFTVEVSPAIRDTLSARLEVTTDTAGTVTSALGASGIAPDIDVDLSALEFDRTRLGNTSDRTIQVNNTGNAPLNVTGVTLSAGDTGQFDVLTESVVVPPKGSRQLEVRFAPGTAPADVTLAHQATERSATLTIASNDTDSSEQSIDIELGGVGVTPALNTSQSDLKYGTVLVDSTTRRTVTIRNELKGTASLRITGATIEGRDRSAYSLTTDPSGTVLQPGQATTLTLEFTPKTLGAKYATLRLQTNDTRQDTAVVFLSNRNTIVRVSYGSVTMDYIDPATGRQPTVDIYRGLNQPAQLDKFGIWTTQTPDFSVTIEDAASAFTNSETSPGFDSIRYLHVTTSDFESDKFENATITFRVTKAEVATRGVSRRAVALYHWNGTAYEKLTTQFVRETQTEYVYEAETTELSEFSIGAGVPAFSFSNERLSATSITVGETVQVSVDVANTGDASGTKTVALEVNGTVEETTAVTVAGGGSATATFDYTPSTPGTYALSINGTSAGTLQVASRPRGRTISGGGGGDAPVSTPRPRFRADLVVATLTRAITDGQPGITGTTLALGDRTSVREIVFDADGVTGEVTVTDLRGLPDGVAGPTTGTLVHIVDIEVPAQYRSTGATVTMTIDRSKLGGAAPGQLRVVHQEADGSWSELPTTVVSISPSEVTLRGRTTAFSLFGVVVTQVQTPGATPATPVPDTPTVEQPTPTEPTPDEEVQASPTAESPTPGDADEDEATTVEEPAGLDPVTLGVIGLVIVVILVALAVLRRRRE